MTNYHRARIPGATCLFTVNLARRDITLLVATCSSTSITSISVRSSTGTSPVPSTDLGQRSIAISQGWCTGARVAGDSGTMPWNGDDGYRCAQPILRAGPALS